MNVPQRADRVDQANPFYRALMQSGIGMSLMSLTATWVAVNPALCALLGYSQAELVGRSVVDHTHPDDVAATRDSIASILAGERTEGSLVKRYLHRDGHVVWVRLHITLVRDEAGNPLYFMARTEDITGEREQAQRLRRAETRFRAAFDAVPVGMAILDLDGRFREVNRAYCNIYGYTEADLLGASVLLVVPPEDRDMVARNLLAAASARATTQSEVRCLHKDGRAIYVRLSESLVLDDDGQPLYLVGHVQDITEQHRTAEARRVSEERLQAVIANAPVTIVSLDAQGVFTFSGGSASLLLGIPHADRVGKSIFELFAPASEIVDAARRVLAGETLIQTMHRPEGWFETSWSPLRDAGGAPAGAIGVTTDITPQKRAEQALAQREAYFRALTEHSGDLVCVLDAQGRVTYESPSYARFLGRPLSEIRAAGGPGALRPEDRALMEASLHKLVVEGAPIAQLESRIADAHGTWHTVETVAVNRLADPAVRGIIATSRDISIRKAAEAALADSEARLRLLVSNTPTILYTLDAAGTFVVCDGKGLAVFGRTSQDLVGTSSFETFRNQPGMLAAIRAALRGEEASLTGLSYGHHFEVRLAPLRDDHGCVAGVTGVALDVTELMHVQQALERSNADLEQFTSVASHDLRSPLNTIGGYAELLSLRYAGTLDAEADEFLHLIVDGVKHMQALVDDLLAFARLGASPAPAEPVECMALVERVLQQLQAAVLDSGAVVTYQNLPTLHGQKSQLRQLFQNLIDNAIKFRGKEAPRVTISAQRQDRHWLFIVADNGIGIDPAYAERIFVIFRRLHSRDDYPGTGIGLAICKKIVEGHGGRIWVESQPGQGTRFLFTLPLAPTH